jgi:Fic family protein
MSPPPIEELFKQLTQSGSKRYLEIARMTVGPTPGGKYRHWDKLRYVPPPDGLTSEEWWLAIKLARNHLYAQLPLMDTSGASFKYAMVDVVWGMLHKIDREAGGAIKGSEIVTSGTVKETYLLKSLFEEAITSSQLEGAATTRKIAKEMLRRRRKPRNRSEQMIFNNFNAMQFIRSLDHEEPLTPGLVLELQNTLTQGTLDDPSASGRLRAPEEEISVMGDYGQILHVPPPSEELPGRLAEMCDFANAETNETFMHPVLRAILLHFWLAYDHPFVDGNGRTARALFYWAMAKHGYWLSEYLSISRILKKAPAQYARSFLHTESDDNDTTYFIIDQLRVISNAIDDLHKYLTRKTRELRETERLMHQTESFRGLLNHRQLALINHALKNQYYRYTFESHRGSHNISYPTARTDLLGLAEYGLLDRTKTGKTFIFTAPSNLRERIETIETRSHGLT